VLLACGLKPNLKPVGCDHVQELYGDAIEIQATRQGGRKLNFDSPNQLFVPESTGLDVSGAAK
jgi:hypothetical protein